MHVEQGTPPPAPPHQGWLGLDGNRGLIWLPVFLAGLSLFFVNTVEPRDLRIDMDIVVDASPVLLKVQPPSSLCYGS
jgi:hypothetical protein